MVGMAQRTLGQAMRGGLHEFPGDTRTGSGSEYQDDNGGGRNCRCICRWINSIGSAGTYPCALHFTQQLPSFPSTESQTTWAIQMYCWYEMWTTKWGMWSISCAAAPTWGHLTLFISRRVLCLPWHIEVLPYVSHERGGIFFPENNSPDYRLDILI